MSTKDKIKLHPDVAAYTRDYRLENGWMVLPTERLEYWANYFKAIPEKEKDNVMVDLLAWVHKCITITGGCRGIEYVLVNTIDIVAQMAGRKPESLLALFLTQATKDGIIDAGDSNLVIRSGEIIDKNVKKTKYDDLPVISAEVAFDRMGQTTAFNLEERRKTMEQSRKQSSQFFRLTLVSASVGFAVIVIAIALFFLRYVALGAITTVAGTISEAVATLFFRKDKELRVNIKSYDSEIQVSQLLLTAVDTAETIENQAERDLAKKEIIRAMLAKIRVTHSPSALS